MSLMYSAPTTNLSKSPSLSNANLRHLDCEKCSLNFIILPWISPELSKVHIEGEIHELLRQVPDGENVESHSDSDRLASIVGSDSSVITNLEGVEDVGDIGKIH